MAIVITGRQRLHNAATANHWNIQPDGDHGETFTKDTRSITVDYTPSDGIHTARRSDGHPINGGVDRFHKIVDLMRQDRWTSGPVGWGNSRLHLV